MSHALGMSDDHWVVCGGSAQAMLIAQGYTLVRRDHRRGILWCLMSKLITPEEKELVDGNDRRLD